MLHQHVHKQLHVAREENLAIITLYWAVCRQLSATLWWLNSSVLLFMSSVDYRAMPPRICSYLLSSSRSVFLLVKEKPGGVQQTVTKYCVAHTNGYIFTPVGGDLCVFGTSPPRDASVCTFITSGGGLQEEFSIRSGSNKSYLTGEMLHQRKRFYCFSSLVLICRHTITQTGGV